MLSARNPLVLYCNGIGDHILSVPTMRALSSLFPRRLTLVSAEGARACFFRDVRFRAVRETRFQPTGTGARWFDSDAVAARVGRCDLLLSLNPWHGNAVDRLLTRLKPAHSIGYFPSFDTVLNLDFSKHSADLTFDVARVLEPTLQLDDFAAPLRLTPAARRWVRVLRRRIPRGLKVLAVHADTKKEKMWPAARLMRLIDEFLERHREFAVVSVGMQPLCRSGCRNAKRIIASHGLPIPLALALVADADLFLGVDSCMLHAADICRVPGVGLFGPTHSQEWGFRFGPSRHVECGPLMNSAGEPEALDALQSLVDEHWH